MTKQRALKIAAVCMAATLAGTGTFIYGIPAKAENTVEITEENTGTQSEEEQLTDAILNRSGDSEAAKDETVYIIANADGSAKEVIVSDWLKNGKAEDVIEDASDLTNIENVKGREDYSGSDENMKWQANGADIYYQGTTNKQLPVDVKVSYRLDGKDITPESLAGKSGKVTIRFDYTNNEKQTVKIDGRDEDIYVPFMMVSGMMLDNEKFTDVEVENGKVISEGNHTIVMGVAMPGLSDSLKLPQKVDLDIPDYVEVTANVTDFSLGMTVTAAMTDMLSDVNTDSDKLDDLDDLDSLEDSLDDLTDASKQLVDGSAELSDGAKDLDDGAKKIGDGAGKLAEGTKTLQKAFEGESGAMAGAKALASGAKQVSDGAKTLDSSVQTLKDGAKQVSDGAGTVSTGASSVSDGANSLSNGANSVLDGANSLSNGADTLSNGAKSLSGGADDIKAGLKDASTGAKAVSDGLGQLKDGASDLADGAKKLDAGVDAMSASLETMYASLKQQKKEAAGAAAQYKAEYEASQDEDALKNYVKYAAAAQTLEEMIAEMEAANLIGNLQALQTGAEQVKDGTADVSENTQKLYAGSCDLASGVNALYGGAESLAAGAKTLSGGASDLAAGAKTLSGGASDLAAGAKTLSGGASDLAAGAKTLAAGAGSLKDGTKQLKAGTKDLSTGAKSVSTGADSLSKGVSRIYTGVKTVNTNMGTLHAGAKELMDGTDKLYLGSVDLKEGMEQFDREGIRELTSKLTEVLDDYDITALKARVNATTDAGKAYTIFTDAAKGTTSSVKFIYKTESIGE